MNIFRAKTFVTVLVTSLLAAPAMSQPGGGGGPGTGGGPPHMGGQPGGPPGGAPGMMPGGPGGGRGGPRMHDDTFANEPPEMRFVRLFRGYLDLVQQMTELSKDPAASGIAAVLSASDILK